jgi:hypothetical protein
MVLANLGLIDVMWSFLVVFFMVTYWMILFRVIVDVFRRDASGGNRAFWLIFLLFAPVVALVAYLIVNGEGLARRQGGDPRVAPPAPAEGGREVAVAGPAQEIAQAKTLLDAGAITPAEYDALKARALA